MPKPPKDEDGHTSYDQIILKHLNRLLEMTTNVAGRTTTGELIVYKDQDKLNSWTWGIRALTSLLPDDLKDNKYEAELKTLQDPDIDDIQYWSGRLHVLVNLLKRRGLLTHIYTVQSGVGRNLNLDDLKELER